MKFKKLLISNFFAMAFFCAGGALAMQDQQEAPPKVNLSDPYHVNIVGGQLSPSLSTVSIGGELGLQHSITMEGNNFAHKGYYGYRDRYSGTARATVIGKEHQFMSQGNPLVDFSVYRVYAIGDSADFTVRDQNDNVLNAAGNITGNYSYKALGDTRHKLTRDSEGGVNYLVWTKPDGTRVKFKDYPSTAAGNTRKVLEVESPNGFTVTVSYGHGVQTNTGYLLKYDYETDDSVLEDSKENASVIWPPESTSATWSGRNPKHILGVNLAYEYCSSSTCNLTGTRPTATFNWPGGMPRAFFIDTSIFSVEDSGGATTSYQYKAYDVHRKKEWGSEPQDGYEFELGKVFSPRLVGIKPSNAKLTNNGPFPYVYTYHNQWITIPPPGVGTATYFPIVSGELKNVTGPMGPGGYQTLPKDQGNTTSTASWKGNKYFAEHDDEHPGALRRAYIEGEVSIDEYEYSFRNFVSKATPAGGPQKTYTYTPEGNLKKIMANGDTLYEAGYPTNNCTPKTCNKPDWIKDANGAQTNFKYHADSGNVSKVTGSSNKDNIHPETRYFYEKKHAYYKKNSSNIEKDNKGIWLLTKESTCIAGAATSNGGCVNASDEVVTEYYYGPDGQKNNLHLRGMSIEAKGEGKKRITCYEYDKYGNQIGVIEPNEFQGSTLSSVCN